MGHSPWVLVVGGFPDLLRAGVFCSRWRCRNLSSRIADRNTFFDVQRGFLWIARLAARRMVFVFHRAGPGSVRFSGPEHLVQPCAYPLNRSSAQPATAI